MSEEEEETDNISFQDLVCLAIVLQSINRITELLC